MSDHSTTAFSSEAGLVEALNEVTHAIHCALTSGRIAHYMNKIDLTLRRALQNQAEGSFPDVFDRPEYRIIWYFFMQWTIFSETPGGDAKIFWHKERASVIAQRLWTPPIQKAHPATAEPPVTESTIPPHQSVVPLPSSAREKIPTLAAVPPTSSARPPTPPVPTAARPRHIAGPTEKARPSAAPVQYGTARGNGPTQIPPKADRSARPSHSSNNNNNNNSNTKGAVYPKSVHRLPSQIAAESRASQAPARAAPIPAQHSTPRHPSQKADAMPTGKVAAAACASGPHALSADMGRMSLTPSVSKFVAFQDVNDDLDEYIPTEEEPTERKRKHHQSSEVPRPKKMRMDERAPAEVIEDDELPGESMDTAPDGKKSSSRPAGIATQFVYVKPCRKCRQRSKVCRVQAGQSGNKPAAACIPCNASKIKCAGQGTEIMIKTVDNEPDVQGDIVEGLTIRPGRKMPKKKTNDTLVIVDQGTSGYSERNDIPESRSPTPPPKPKSAKFRPKPTIIAPEDKSLTPEPSLSIVHGLMVEMLGKKLDELAARLEGRFEERFDELAERLEKHIAQGFGQLADMLDETLEERFSLVEHAIVDIKTAAVSGMLSGELSPDMTGTPITHQSPLLPTVIVTAPTPSQSQDLCPADIEMDAQDALQGVTEDERLQSGSPAPMEGRDNDMVDLGATSTKADEAAVPIPEADIDTAIDTEYLPLPPTTTTTTHAAPEDRPSIAGADIHMEMEDNESSKPQPHDLVTPQLPNDPSPPPAPLPTDTIVGTTDVPPSPTLKMAPPDNSTLGLPLPSSDTPTTSTAMVPSSLVPSRLSLAPPAQRTLASRSRSLSSAPAHLPPASSLAPPDMENARRSARLRSHSHSPLPAARAP